MHQFPLEVIHLIAKNNEITWYNLTRVDGRFHVYAFSEEGRAEFVKLFTRFIQFDEGSFTIHEFRLLGRLHHEKCPARTKMVGDYEYLLLLTVQEQWYRAGQLHREDGPADIKYHGGGSKETEMWYQYGVPYRANDQPTITHYEFSRRNIVLSEYWCNIHNQRHRVDKPAYIRYEDGSIAEILYFLNDKLHRTDGPAYQQLIENSFNQYYINGQSHNELGPAIEYLTQPGHFYYLNDIQTDCFGILPLEVLKLIAAADETTWYNLTRVNDKFREYAWSMEGCAEFVKQFTRIITTVETKYTYENYILFKQIHRTDGPAQITYYGAENRVLICNEWFLKNKLHREDGPARIEYCDDRPGVIQKEEWYQNDRRYRENDLPNYVFYNYCRLNPPGKGCTICWRNDDEDLLMQRHRLNGPAQIEYRRDGTLSAEYYYVNGIMHRTDGPAWTQYDLQERPKCIYYIVNDKKHDELGPAVIAYGPNNHWYYLNDVQTDCFGILPLEVLKLIAAADETTWYNLTRVNDKFRDYAFSDIGRTEFVKLFTKIETVGISVTYKLLDKLHREDGPAEIYYHDTHSKTVKIEQYYRVGQLHREDGPAIIECSYDKKTTRHLYYINDKLHRDTGPAAVYYHDGKPVRKNYYKNGICHHKEYPF